MKISIAQTQPISGDIPTNIAAHKKLIDLAIVHNADAIFFPELSLTGYEPALAMELATTYDDDKFEDFQNISNKNSITIGLGMPTTASPGVHISMLIFHPNSPRQVYSKQELHADEFPYFVKGEGQIILTINNKKIAPAICYESLQSNHSYNAHKLGADIYLASVAKSQKSVDKAMTHYPSVAKKFSMTVLMSNCVGYCDNFQSVGQSAVWTKQGNLIGQLDVMREGILIFNTETEELIRHTV